MALGDALCQWNVSKCDAAFLKYFCVMGFATSVLCHHHEQEGHDCSPGRKHKSRLDQGCLSLANPDEPRLKQGAHHSQKAWTSPAEFNWELISDQPIHNQYTEAWAVITNDCCFKPLNMEVLCYTAITSRYASLIPFSLTFYIDPPARSK